MIDAEELRTQLAETLVMSRNRQMDAAALLPVVRRYGGQRAADELEAVEELLTATEELTTGNPALTTAVKRYLRIRAAVLRGEGNS